MGQPISQKKRFTIEELLRGMDKKGMKDLNVDTAWAREGGLVGREKELVYQPGPMPEPINWG